MIVKTGRKENDFSITDNVSDFRYTLSGTSPKEITTCEIKQTNIVNSVQLIDLSDIECIYLCNDAGKTIEVFYPSR